MGADSGLRTFFVRVSQPATLAEIIALLVALGVAIAAGRLVQTWRRRHPVPEGSWNEVLYEAAVIAAPIVCALVLLLALHLLLYAAATPRAAVDVALELTTALLLMRLAVYGLRMLVGRETWLDAWEPRIALALWLLVSMSLLGWLDRIQGMLERVRLLPGRDVVTLWQLLKGIVVVTLFVIVTTLVARTVERRVMRIHAIALSTRVGISKFSYFVLLGIGVLLGVNAAGVDVTTLNVLTGAIGIGLGFGLQTIAGNFVSGVVLLIDKSIKPGDVISFTGHTGTSTENFGWVQELRGRYVVVRDRDGVETLVPNQNLITSPVINWSYSDERVRLRLPVTVSYDDDPEVALEALLEAVQDHPRILHDPQPVTRLMAFEDYGMRLEVRFWIADPMNGVNNVRSDVNRAIWRVFKRRGIKIPVAQRELRMLPPHGPPATPPGGTD
ncbi:MAG TPA: mechanosensitive ion channel domain-containing protein [Steroidobacteraceae bacterium]|nr:mechanosensitive ion channel domain-containing protein [Steroidobacteraceae bacterium]